MDRFFAVFLRTVFCYTVVRVRDLLVQNFISHLVKFRVKNENEVTHCGKIKTCDHWAQGVTLFYFTTQPIPLRGTNSNNDVIVFGKCYARLKQFNCIPTFYCTKITIDNQN